MGQNLTKSGVVVWGSIEYNQLGTKTEEINSEPQIVENLRHFNRISKVSCGSNYSAAITNTGELILWGHGSSGQLGFGTLDDSSIPRINLSIKNVIQVSCSDRHTAAILDNGELYTWGCSKNGKLGHGEFELSIGNSVISQPKLIKALIGEKVIQVSCGSHHTGCLTLDNKAFTWGLGLQGRLGHGDTNDIFSPKLIETLAGLPIKDISCGGHHTAIILNTGKLYMFGGGAFGKLGLGSKDDVYIPKQVGGSLSNFHILKVSLGYQHSAIVTKCGKVFTWGQGGRLGHIYNGPEHDLLVPKKLSALEKVFIIDISCGHSHTAALSDIGDIYTWGLTRNLGHGVQNIHPNMPTKHPILRNKNIVEVVCGKSHSIALSDIEVLVQKTSEIKKESYSERETDKSPFNIDKETKSEIEELIKKKIEQGITENEDIIEDKDKIDYLLTELKRSEEENAILVSLLDISVRKLEILRKENEELKQSKTS